MSIIETLFSCHSTMSGFIFNSGCSSGDISNSSKAEPTVLFTAITFRSSEAIFSTIVSWQVE